MTAHAGAGGESKVNFIYSTIPAAYMTVHTGTSSRSNVNIVRMNIILSGQRDDEMFQDVFLHSHHTKSDWIKLVQCLSAQLPI